LGRGAAAAVAAAAAGAGAGAAARAARATTTAAFLGGDARLEEAGREAALFLEEGADFGVAACV
jgi:hypothetical protein